MIAALTINLTVKPVTEWLLWGVLGFAVAGPVLMACCASWELGAVVPLVVCWCVAAVLIVLAIGTLL